MHVYIFSCSVHLFFMFPWLEEGGLTSYRTALVQNQHLAVLARVGLEESWIYLTFQVTWWIFIVVAHWNNSLQTCYSTRVHYHDSEPTSLYSYSLKCSTKQLLHRCGFFSNQHLAVLENVLLVIYIFFLWSHQVVYIFPLISPSGLYFSFDLTKWFYQYQQTDHVIENYVVGCQSHFDVTNENNNVSFDGLDKHP